jgi:hypothetical protein
MGRIIDFATRECKAPLAHGEPAAHSDGPFEVIIPTDLAKEVRCAALWAGKNPKQFVLEFIFSAFPPRGVR